MMATIKAELRKLLTVRSTYVLTAIVLAFAVFIAGFALGYKLDVPALADPLAVQGAIRTAVTVTAVFTAIAGILLMTHEYRYNTILYTLTSTRRRAAILVAKAFIVSMFSLLVVVAVGLLAAAATYIGVKLASHSLAPQHFYYSDLIWRCLFYGWGYSMIGLVMAAIIRSQVGALIAFLIIPSTVEGLLGLLLKDKVNYLPFTALGGVIDRSSVLGYGQAAAVSLAYIVVGWFVAWLLFVRRDAN